MEYGSKSTSSEKRVFHAIDLDRTLFNTTVMQQKLENYVADNHQKLGAKLREEGERYAARGESFFIFDYLRQQLGETEYQQLIAGFEQSVSPKELLLPGVKDRLDFANSRPGWRVGIITYGSNDDQVYKIGLAGLSDLPYMVTDIQDKGQVISEWLQPDGTFLLPKAYGGGVVDSVVLDDDKLRAFDSLPKGAYGIWVTDQPLSDTASLVAPKSQVYPVNGLFDSVSTLKGIFGEIS